VRPPHASPGCASRFRTEVAYAARNATTVTGISRLKLKSCPAGVARANSRSRRSFFLRRHPSGFRTVVAVVGSNPIFRSRTAQHRSPRRGDFEGPEITIARAHARFADAGTAEAAAPVGWTLCKELASQTRLLTNERSRSPLRAGVER
jgi:hypothetical protein